MEILRPAQLSFLTIYNPFLGRTDETLHNQVVYYYTAEAKTRKGLDSEEIEQADHEERNERLRQIGLAQGMVEFAKAFSDGQSIESIDAEKSRIVLHELEEGWWILASIDLTRLRHAPSHSRSKSEAGEPTEEFSAREVDLQELLLQQMLRAHTTFLLHQASSLQDLYVRLTRDKFCGMLETYWNRFVATWDVLLHGNPSVDIFNGIKLAAGGELGVGVGEEEWGSGEREVLEGFIGRTEGLVDVVVSRFGDEAHDTRQRSPWLGTGQLPGSNDGVVFSGIGGITRPSVRALSAWMENIYQCGGAAYGITDNPQSARRRQKKKQSSMSVRPAGERKSLEQRGRPPAATVVSPSTGSPPGIPPPIVKAADASLAAVTNRADQHDVKGEQPASGAGDPWSTENWVKYMTLGVYGSTWGIPGGRPHSENRDSEGEPTRSASPAKGKQPPGGESTSLQQPLRHIIPRPLDGTDPNAGFDVEKGCFIIGLRGDLESDADAAMLSGDDREPGAPSGEEENQNQRIVVRPVYLERRRAARTAADSTASPSPLTAQYQDRNRVVLYARRPFLFAFVFAAITPSLAYATLYRDLHYQLQPLHRSLLRSTTPAAAYARTKNTIRSPRTVAESAGTETPIYDLLYNPSDLTIITSLPGIPELGSLAAEGIRRTSKGSSWTVGREASPTPDPQTSVPDDWTRREALALHVQVVQTVLAARKRPADRERLLKTGRGWWVVWLRVQGPKQVDKKSDGLTSRAENEDNGEGRWHEAVLIRQASDYPAAGRKSGAFGLGGIGSATGSPAKGAGAGGAGGKDGVGKIAEGIGVDARRYVEDLLRLHR